MYYTVVLQPICRILPEGYDAAGQPNPQWTKWHSETEVVTRGRFDTAEQAWGWVDENLGKGACALVRLCGGIT